MTYLVAWVIRDQLESFDHWEVYEELESAQARYAEVLKFDDLYTASIFSNVVASTDYEVTPEDHDPSGVILESLLTARDTGGEYALDEAVYNGLIKLLEN